jgi:ABC-2 type transport system ATP-binding protein
VLNLSRLKKQFDGVLAVDEVSFRVEQGDVYGFLGPNGAGKTTTIRMIMGIIHQDSGSIELNEQDINQLGRNKLGYLPEDRGLYQKQRLEETIVYFGILRGLNRIEAKSNASMWLERFDLADRANRKVEELSKGNQQKIQFILSLIHDPKLLILDEPFSGLDPLNQLLLKEIIQEKREAGTTILFSTHQMEQVERLCTNICLINEGKIIIEGSLNTIRESYKSNAVEVKYSGDLNQGKAESFFSEVEVTDLMISGVLNEKPSDFLDWINAEVVVESFRVKTPSLEQIFIQEVEKAS